MIIIQYLLIHVKKKKESLVFKGPGQPTKQDIIPNLTTATIFP